MSTTIDKMKGLADEAIGAAKKSVGELIGDDGLRVEGAVQQGVGIVKEAVANASAKIHEVVDEVSHGGAADKVRGVATDALGKTKEAVGEAVGSTRLQAEGLADQAKGAAQKAVGDAKQSAGK